ncbi:hypothetical protein A7K91_20485 [Paenibacillus oryzae]|uniref:Uncharacterized protein n=1 Tax=Paenibacillus oryzae TaxID=1844972 RepID=A0A1A5YEK2_9BACL|nr:hypothetical protein [Paenibacillus oryzae]OBR64071.1 hypothetical protein A7K91_20485 [Paenibacillus oryzae]
MAARNKKRMMKLVKKKRGKKKRTPDCCSKRKKQAAPLFNVIGPNGSATVERGGDLTFESDTIGVEVSQGSAIVRLEAPVGQEGPRGRRGKRGRRGFEGDTGATGATGTFILGKQTVVINTVH